MEHDHKQISTEIFNEQFNYFFKKHYDYFSWKYKDYGIQLDTSKIFETLFQKAIANQNDPCFLISDFIFENLNERFLKIISLLKGDKMDIEFTRVAKITYHSTDNEIRTYGMYLTEIDSVCRICKINNKTFKENLRDDFIKRLDVDKSVVITYTAIIE